MGLRRRQWVTVALLFFGYAACYFCRADFAVATPLLIDELVGQGSTHAEAIVRLGQIASLGTLAYALGKLLLTGLGDLWGGRRNFLLGLGGATLFSVIFALGGGLPIFTLAWLGNRLTQSVAWSGLVKVSSRWFDFSSHGTVIGVLSVSYLIGDAVAREWMGSLLAAGYGWRTLFYLGAAVAGVLFLANLWWLRESREEMGHAEALVNPSNLYGENAAPPKGFRELAMPLLRSPAFLMVCALSLGCTVIRETFNTWTPVYLRDHAHFSMVAAAKASAVFPALGAVSVILTGWLSDRLGANSRAGLLALGLLLAGAAMMGLMSLNGTAKSWVPVFAIGVTAFCLLGPYSYLGGAFALDFGGKQGSALSSGIIDGTGYLGSVLAGDTVARMSVDYGWKGVFLLLAGVSAVSACGALWLFRRNVRSAA